MRKILALILALCMVLSTMGTVVFADSTANVAKVGNIEYPTIDEAIANWTANTTLTLLDDVTLNDVITLKSTEHHILDLGTYTMTAASKKNAIEITPEGAGTAAKSCLTINADENNPGGITSGKSCISYRKTNGINDRLMITINGGVFNGTISSSSNNGGQACPYFVFNGGTFNSSINLTKAMLKVTGGTFNGMFSCTGDSTAYRLISGGTFKFFTFMTADAPNKFAIGSAKSVYDVGLYVDANNYLVIGGPVKDTSDSNFGAHTTYGIGWNKTCLKYSSAATYGMHYMNADKAITDTNSESGDQTITLFANSNTDAKPKGNWTIDCSSGAVYSGNVKLQNPSASIKIILPENEVYTGIVTQSGDNNYIVVEEKIENGKKIITYNQKSTMDDEEVILTRENSKTLYSFEKALEVAIPGDTITLQKDISCNVNTTRAIALLALSNTVKIDLNEKTLSASDPEIPTFINGETYVITNGTIIGDVVNNGGELIFDGVNVEGDVVINAGSADITGGKFTGAVTVADEDALDITGGRFFVDPTAYVSDGYDVIRHDSYYEVKNLSLEAKSISVEFVKTDVSGTVDNLEGKDTYNIVLKANAGDEINELASADLTFKFSGTPVNGGAMAYSIVAVDNMTLTKIDDRYMFNYSGSPVFEDSGESLVIGELTIDGYGLYTFSTVDTATNIVNATTFYDNLVDYYVKDGDTDASAATGGLVVADYIDTEIKVPTRTLTVNVTFPNAVIDNSADYQNMKVEITGNIDGVTQTIPYALGDGSGNNAVYVVEEDRLVLNESYTVTVSGAGYRTARYTVTMTDNKKLNFWNNVKDNKVEIEEGKVSSAVELNFLAGDIVADNNINIYDLSAVVSYFTQQATIANGYVKYDLNRDGKIDSKDVAYILVSWGK